MVWREVKFKKVPFRMSQSYRTVEVGKDVWTSLGANSQLRLGHLELLAQDCVQMTFKYFQGWRLHSFSGQCMPVLGHLHSKKKKCSLMFRQNLLYFSSVPVATELCSTFTTFQFLICWKIPILTDTHHSFFWKIFSKLSVFLNQFC